MPRSFFDREPKLKSVAQMMERLKILSSQPVKRESLPRPPLVWLPRGKHQTRILTTNGKYSIDATKIDGVWHFDAWRGQKHLGRTISGQAAKKLCDDDLLTAP